MKTRFLLFAVFLLVCSTAFGQDSDNAKFIEVTGTSEITLVPTRFIILSRLKNIGKRNLTESPNRRIIGPKYH